MEKTILILIERAQSQRDRHAVLSGEAAAALAQSHATLARLVQFRVECLARSPSSVGSRSDAQALSGYQRFISRLDEAIGMQQRECERRQALHDGAQRQLTESQQRLMALETLVQRWATARAAKQERRAQRDADEFAARAARLRTQEEALP